MILYVGTTVPDGRTVTNVVNKITGRVDKLNGFLIL